MKYKLLITILLGMFLISFASAGMLDNKKSFEDKTDFNLNGKTLKYNKLWEKYKPSMV